MSNTENQCNFSHYNVRIHLFMVSFCAGCSLSATMRLVNIVSVVISKMVFLPSDSADCQYGISIGDLHLSVNIDSRSTHVHKELKYSALSEHKIFGRHFSSVNWRLYDLSVLIIFTVHMQI